MVGLRRESHAKLRHRVYVWGMFVSEEARSAGIGRRLMQAAIAISRELGVDWIDLSVTDEAGPAIEMYQSLGFFEWGTEEDALKVLGSIAFRALLRPGSPRSCSTNAWTRTWRVVD